MTKNLEGRVKKVLTAFSKESTKAFVHGRDRPRAGKALSQATARIMELMLEVVGEDSTDCVCAGFGDYQSGYNARGEKIRGRIKE